MRLRVDPGRLAETAAPLRLAVDVARDVQAARDDLKAQAGRVGAEQVRRATEGFLDAWSAGLGGVADRGDALVRMLHLAASSYGEVEERVRRSQPAEGVPGP
jgi:hypothetical protein